MGNLLGFSYLDARMLRVGVGVCTWGRLKRHWTDRALVEDFTVRALNVRLQCGHVRVHNIAMYTSVRETILSLAQTTEHCEGHHCVTGRSEHISQPTEVSRGFWKVLLCLQQSQVNFVCLRGKIMKKINVQMVSVWSIFNILRKDI